MIRKNEGYALPFVLVVSIVMCLIAVAVMSFSLDNLQAQQNSIQRMQAKYEATGQIEQLIAQILQANAENSEAGYRQDEKDDLVFSVNEEEKQFTVAATNADKTVWVVAVLEATGNTDEFMVTRKVNGADPYGYLTVVGCSGLKYVEYKVVNEETAREYVPHLKQSESEVAQ